MDRDRRGGGSETRAALWLVVAAVALPTAAVAQLPANNGGGRALDANPGVGSGGTNRLENQIDFQARNNLVTGNVAGGRAFQDDVPFLAPGAFSGGLESEELFSFRAESLRSAPIFANIPTAQTINNVGGGEIVVFNSATTVAPNRINPNTPTRFAPQGGVFRVNNATSFGRFDPQYELTLDRRPSPATINRFDPVSRDNTLGVFRVEDGSALAVTADPLLGVRRRTLIDARRSPADATDPALTPGRPGAPDPPGLPGRGTPGEIDPATGRINPEAGGRAANYLAPAGPDGLTQPLQGPADNAEFLQQQNAFADGTGLAKPTLRLGQLVTNPANASFATVEARVEALQRSIFGPNAPEGSAPAAPAPAVPGTDRRAAETPQNAYTRLLEEIREQARTNAENRAAAAERDGGDARPAWMRALQEPSDRQLEEAEQSLEATLERIRRGVRANQAERRAAPGQATDAADGDPDARSGEAAAVVNELLTDLSYSVRIETLVAEREGRLNELFERAETQLAAGQFLPAERTYRQIRLEAVDNPLGQAGLIHAQLGAGMVRSATFNLRALFEQHPELIATRYGPNLLPPTERLEWLQAELQRMVDTGSSSLEPGLMLAYLGHQVESRQLVRYGLAIAEDASPLDPLIPVLRQIWLDQKPAAAPPDAAPSE